MMRGIAKRQSFSRMRLFGRQKRTWASVHMHIYTHMPIHVPVHMLIHMPMHMFVHMSGRTCPIHLVATRRGALNARVGLRYSRSRAQLYKSARPCVHAFVHSRTNQRTRASTRTACLHTHTYARTCMCVRACMCQCRYVRQVACSRVSCVRMPLIV